MNVRTSNDAIFEILEPFVVVAPWHRELLDYAPFGLAVPDGNVVDPTRTASAQFLARLSKLDGLTFGSTGMPMPPWVFYHTAEVPGAIFGFAHRVESLAAPLAERLQLAPGEGGLMPLSMYIAMPTRAPRTWLGHNLASLNRRLPELKLAGLASITKAVALAAFRCAHQVGAFQWGAPAVRVHTRFAPLEMLTAWTPAHARPATVTYRWAVTEQGLRSGLGDRSARVQRPAADFEVAPDDHAAIQDLQARIEAGQRFMIPGPPRRGGGQRIPVAELSAGR